MKKIILISIMLLCLFCNPVFTYHFSEGLAIVYNNEKFGFIDTSGNFVIEPEYVRGFNFKEGLARVQVIFFHVIYEILGDDVDRDALAPVVGHAFTHGSFVRFERPGVDTVFLEKGCQESV